uniref:Uncharacterized protein n=1 Tax=Lepeophtheirus salmonis TaxID=72036 RepID=A0A0K2TKL9_LEPSM
MSGFHISLISSPNPICLEIWGMK